MPRLRVLAGPSPDSLEPITHTVNTYNAFPIVSPGRFEGTVVVHIKGFKGDSDDVKSDDDSYFDRKERKGVTWSIEVKGRFLKDISSDDVLFGNTFDRKLILPWGSGAALKFMRFIDPTLQHALDSERPWALSPLIVTMPYLSHSEYSSRPQTPSSTTSSLTARTERSSTKSIAPLEEDTSTLPGIDVILATPAKRRAFFSAPERRKQVVFTPNDLITTDFCYGFLSFPRLRLDLPGGISFDLMKYWDGQPVRFVCCERRKDGQPGPGESFWCVVFEVVEEDE